MFRILLPTWFGFLKDCQIRKHFSRSHISEEWHVIVSYYFINSYVSFREKQYPMDPAANKVGTLFGKSRL